MKINAFLISLIILISGCVPVIAHPPVRIEPPKVFYPDIHHKHHKHHKHHGKDNKGHHNK